MDLSLHHDTLRHLTRTDPDPRVRQRSTSTVSSSSRSATVRCAAAAQLFGCSRTSLRAWGQRFLTEGRSGLVDRGRHGRPPKLDATAREVLETALAARRRLPSHDLDGGRSDECSGSPWLPRQHSNRLAGPARAGLSLPTSPARSHPSAGCRGGRLRQARLGGAAKKGAAAGAGFRLVYVDACDLHTHPHLAQVWQRRGHPVIVPAAGKISVEPSSGRWTIGRAR